MDTQGALFPDASGDEQGQRVPPAARPLDAARRRLDGLKPRPKKRKKRNETLRQRRARTQPAREKSLAVRPITISLKAPHWVGGIAYGPGPVTVHPDLARALLENERRVEYNNRRFDGTQAAFITPARGNTGSQFTVTQVNPAVFDSPLLAVMEAIVQ